MLLALALIASLGWSQERPSPRTINVSGTGEVYVAPDMATVTIGVETNAKTAKEAMDAANSATSALLKRLADLKIPREQIQTSRLQLMPIYENVQAGPGRQRTELTGYRATNMLTVRVFDLTLVGAVVDAVTASGSNRVQGIAFGLRNDKEARLRALAEAVASAREKAATIAKALGVSLGPVYEVQEGGVHVVPPPMDVAFTRMAAAESTPVEAGELRVSASVTLRYLIGGS